MTIVFVGTRGYIEQRTRRHFRHTATVVLHRRRRVMIDCGEDWTHHVARIRPDAIVLTHAHPDHALGLAAGSRCPVYATAESWAVLRRLPIEPAKRRVMAPRRRVAIAGVGFEAFPVVHSVRAPAVGFRITAGGGRIFYVPDVLALSAAAAALSGIRIYVGDGATIVRPIVRRERIAGTLVGHAPVRTQLDWCRDAGVPRMIVTHCGSQIVAGEPRRVTSRLETLAAERGVAITVAYDGMRVVVRGARRRGAARPGDARPECIRRPAPPARR